MAGVERALEGKVSVVLATQHLNHMYSITADKNPVCALEIGYTVFFQWKQIKELKARLSHPVPSFCHLVNSSIQQGCYSINKCERLESRLKKIQQNFDQIQDFEGTTQSTLQDKNNKYFNI